MSEDYYDIGLHFAKTGSLSLPFLNPWSAVERPPGYSFFLGTILKIWSKISTNGNALLQTNIQYMDLLRTDTERESAKIIYFVQAILLSISTIFIFIWLSDYMRISISFVVALLFGCNPYMIIYVGLLHYGIIHIFLIIISSYALMYVLSKNRLNGWKMILLGILWGLTTLTRPTTLILPAFIFVFFLIVFSNAKIKAIRVTLLFTVGMIITIAPYTIRNFHLTNHLIPVNLQSGIALWDGTVTKLKRTPNHYRFWEIWYQYGSPIYREIAEQELKEFPIELDRKFKDEAIHNILSQPDIYLYNVANSFISICIDINSVFIKIFQAIQVDKHSHYSHMNWIKEGNPQNFYSSTYQKIFEFYIYALTFFSFSGILLFIKRFLSHKKNTTKERQLEYQRDVQANGSRGAIKSHRVFWIENSYFLGTIIICITLFIAHSITFLDLMYYYQKMPFLFLFTAYFFNEIDKITISTPDTGFPYLSKSLLIKISWLLLSILLLYGIIMTFLIIIIPSQMI